MKLQKNKDGTFIVLDSSFGPYQVVSKDIDPYNQYDLTEIQQYASEHPEDVTEE